MPDIEERRLLLDKKQRGTPWILKSRSTKLEHDKRIRKLIYFFERTQF